MIQMKMIEELSKKALDYAAEQYGPQRRGEQVWDPHTYDKKLAELIIFECAEVARKCRDEEWYDVEGAIYERFGMQAPTEKCMECGQMAVWMRSTQFAGEHPFCEEHAKLEKDFGQSDSYSYWYQL